MRAFLPGDGEGRNGVWLVERGLVVTTVDSSPVGVDKARRLAASRRVKLDAHVGDLRDWKYPVAVFDLVVLAFVHVDAGERSGLHAEVATTLRPGGHLLLEGFTPDHLGRKGGPKSADRMFTAATLADDFSGLDILCNEECEVELPAAERHGGLAAVVRLLAIVSRGVV
ncbi:MAG: class I SAM-dependent methyltransferase [Alphaproteobacteria bacterium]|nr:class I SAM-dependent methyltransferase [Alphaproteobacteria bacterium]